MVLLDSAHRINQIFVRPKNDAPSWPKAVHPFADGEDVATHGLSIGLLLASLFHD
jgi:hypothetical protein